jgi:hypothetical protein
MRVSVALLALTLAACATTPPPQVVVVEQPPPQQAVAEPPPPVAPPPAARGPRMSDAQIAADIVHTSRAAYYATGHPCACPDDTTRSGRSCGATSAYMKAGGIKCSPRDVTRADIANYRQQTGM